MFFSPIYVYIFAEDPALQLGYSLAFRAFGFSSLYYTLIAHFNLLLIAISCYIISLLTFTLVYFILFPAFRSSLQILLSCLMKKPLFLVKYSFFGNN